MNIAGARVGGGGHNNTESNPAFRGMAGPGLPGRVFTLENYDRYRH